jgi:ethanolamine-phosphate cytidylyltransferase
VGCRYTDDVLIDAPFTINEDMIDSLHITEVVLVVDGEVQTDKSRFHVACDRGILHCMKQPNDFSLERIVRRIQHNQQTFRAQFERKKKAEETFYNGKRKINGSRN